MNKTLPGKKDFIKKYSQMKANKYKTKKEILRETEMFFYIIEEFVLKNGFRFPEFIKIEQKEIKARAYRNIIEKSIIEKNKRIGLKIKVAKNFKKKLNEK